MPVLECQEEIQVNQEQGISTVVSVNVIAYGQQ